MKKAVVNATLEIKQTATNAVKTQKATAYVKKKLTVTREFFEAPAEDKAFQGISLSIGAVAGLTTIFSSQALVEIERNSNSVPLTEDQIKQVLDRLQVEENPNVPVENNSDDNSNTRETESKKKESRLERDNEILKVLAQAGGVVIAGLIIALFSKPVEVIEKVLNNSGQYMKELLKLLN